MPTSVRLDPETEALLREMARRTGRTKSDILREAVMLLVQSEQGGVKRTPYETVADLLGIAEGGPSDLARRGREILKGKLTSRQRSR